MTEFVYVSLLFLVLRFCVTLFNFLSNPKLGYYGKHFTDQVSIVILSADDDNIEPLLNSIKDQNYEHTEVIIQRTESLTASVERATGKYLLFLSPDVVIKNGLINNLIYRAKVFNLAILSLIPNYKLSGFLANCIYPLNDFLLLNLLPLRLVRLSSNSVFASGSTDCLFFDAKLYREYNWHERLENKRFEATELIKIVKQHQFKAETLIANKFLYRHKDAKSMNGYASLLLTNFGGSTFVTVTYLLLVLAGPVILLADFNLALAILPFGLIFLSRVMIAFLTAQNPLVQVIMHPLQLIMLFFLTLRKAWQGVVMSIKRRG